MLKISAGVVAATALVAVCAATVGCQTQERRETTQPAAPQGEPAPEYREQAPPPQQPPQQQQPGADAGGDAQAGALNDRCPVSGNELAADSSTVEYEGHRIGLCSAQCAAVWENAPEQNRAAYVQQLLAQQEEEQ